MKIPVIFLSLLVWIEIFFSFKTEPSLFILTFLQIISISLLYASSRTKNEFLTVCFLYFLTLLLPLACSYALMNGYQSLSFNTSSVILALQWGISFMCVAADKTLFPNARARDFGTRELIGMHTVASIPFLIALALSFTSQITS